MCNYIHSSILVYVFTMKIKIPRAVTKDQIFVVFILGTITGVYQWNSPLQGYMKEQCENIEKKQESNEVFNRTISFICIIT